MYAVNQLLCFRIDIFKAKVKNCEDDFRRRFDMV